MLQILYKLKSNRLFEKNSGRACPEDEALAVQHLHLCCENRLLCVAGATHLILFKFNQQDTALECPVGHDCLCLLQPPPNLTPVRI